MMDFGYYNMDCMDGMKEFPDKYFDIAVVDPPYGININCNIGRRKGDKKSAYPKAYWDSEIPDEKYFDELFRVSKKQIIWGGQLLLSSTNKMFPCLAKTTNIRKCKFLNVRVCLD